MPLLSIRKAQMTVFERALLLPWLEMEIQALYPEECGAMGSIELKRFVVEAVQRAEQLDIPGSDCLAYLAMEISFGKGFTDDPSNKWARDALPGDRDSRMQRLRRAGMFKLAEQLEHERRQENARLEDEKAAQEREARLKAASLGEGESAEIETRSPAGE